MRVQVRVKPHARRQRIDTAEDGSLVVHVTSPPVEGRANQELIGLLARHYGVTRGCVRIKAGASGRNKLVEIDTEAAG
jgi:hypothetical protein